MSELKQKNVKLVEVGPRDGLQNEKKILSTEAKFEYIKLLSETGLQTIEVTSFVSPKAIPQMSDSKELYTKVNKKLSDKINYPCLVPNLIGYEGAKSVGVKEIALFSATSDAFTQKNINCTVDESFKRMSDVASEAKKDGIKLRGYISTAFGCPYAGEMSVDKLDHVLDLFFKLGVYEVSIGDTIVTGGNSLIFPKGIPIGYVDSYKLDNSQNYLELEIQLATDMANIEKIYVLKNNNLSEINSLYE